MNTKTLCKILGIKEIEKTEKAIRYDLYCREKIRNPRSVVITNNETGVVLTYPSICSAGKALGVGSGSIRFQNGKSGKIKNVTYSVQITG